MSSPSNSPSGKLSPSSTANQAPHPLCSSPDYFAGPLPPLPPHATYESIPSPPPNPPALRARAATISAPTTSNSAARMAAVSDLFERTAARAQEVAANGAQPERIMVTTPTPVFPSIGPGLIVPPPFLAPPVMVETHASAQIATPQPLRSLPTASRLAEIAAESGEERTSRKDKKRPRLDTPSPSPSPAPSTSRQGGGIRRSNQILRGRAPPSSRTQALAPSAWMSPASSYGRLAPSAAAAIAAALLPMEQPVAGPSRLPLPPRMRTAEVARAGRATGAGTRLDAIDESQAPEEPMFEDDIDIPLDLTPSPDREVFAFDQPLRPLVSGSARAPTDFAEVMARSPRRDTRTASAEEDRWSGILSPIGPDAQQTAATPARPLAQSAALLAATTSLLSQTRPATVQGQTGLATPATQAGATNLLVANQGGIPMNPGMGGGITFTPTPPGGFPEVVFSEPDGVFQGLARARVEALTAPASGSDDDLSVVLQVHNSGPPPQHEVQALTIAITAAIRRITGGLNPLVIPPEREWTVANDRRATAPISWAVVGLSAAEVRSILVRPTWSSTVVSLHAHEAVVRIGRFMFVAGGFAHDRNGSILSAIFAVFVGDVALPALFALVQANPRFADVAPEEAVRTILASLEVRVSTLQNGNLTAAVFCDSPTQSIVRWREWRDLIATRPFPSPLNSTGFARRPAPCAGCHGGDHPTHLCPFQDVPGWNAPPPGTTWRHPTTLTQGTNGQQPPPPPPPPGGSTTRTRSQPLRRNHSTYPSAGPKRDNTGGGSGGFGMGGGPSGFGPGGAGTGASSFA